MYDYNLLVTIDRALKMRQKNRFQAAAEWLEDLENQPKKHPLPPAMIRFDPNLENDIARIVEITNTQMTKVQGGDPVQGRTRKATPLKPAEPVKQDQTLFDIFGNPIDDFEQWQQEQEREIESRHIADAQADASSKTGKSKNTNMLTRLIYRCFSRNSSSDTAPSNS